MTTSTFPTDMVERLTRERDEAVRQRDALKAQVERLLGKMADNISDALLKGGKS